MPKGSPKSQTRATAKYLEKVGIISRSFKMKKELAEAFKEACEKRGLAQSPTVVKLLEGFINGTIKLD